MSVTVKCHRRTKRLTLRAVDDWASSGSIGWSQHRIALNFLHYCHTATAYPVSEREDLHSRTGSRGKVKIQQGGRYV